VLEATVEDLREAGYIITLNGEHVKMHKIAPSEENEHVLDWQGDQTIRFGVVSDTHLGSKWRFA
jgi:hypothetical protein